MSSLTSGISDLSDKLELINKYIRNLPSHKDNFTNIEKSTSGYYVIQSVLDKNAVIITVTHSELVKACRNCENTKITETIDKYITDKLYDKFLEKISG